MSATETIIGFAVKTALDKAIGGPTSIVTGYHKVHFTLLYRVIKEAERDGKIQDDIRKIQKNLESLTASGRALLNGIPQKAEPPSADGAFFTDKDRTAAFSQAIKAFQTGVQNVVERLRQYVDTAREIETRTEKELSALEKRLDSKNVKSGAMRQISNARRQQDIDLIRVGEMEQLIKVRSAAESRLKAYLNWGN